MSPAECHAGPNIRFFFFQSRQQAHQSTWYNWIGNLIKTCSALQLGLTLFSQIKKDGAASRNKKDEKNALPSRVSHLQVWSQKCVSHKSIKTGKKIEKVDSQKRLSFSGTIDGSFVIGMITSPQAGGCKNLNCKLRCMSGFDCHPLDAEDMNCIAQCGRKVPQGELQWGKWPGYQVKFVRKCRSFENMQWQDTCKQPEKPRATHSWMGFWPKLGERECADGKPGLWCC